MFRGLKRFFKEESVPQKAVLAPAAPQPSSAETSAFLDAAGAGDNKTVTAFLNKYGSAVVDLKDTFGTTALMYAAASRRIETVCLLLENGACINERDNYEYTPLIWATRFENNKDTIALLLEKGADINAADIYDFTALKHARMNNHREAAALIEQWPAMQKQRKEQALADALARELDEITKTVRGGLTRPLPYKDPFEGMKP